MRKNLQRKRISEAKRKAAQEKQIIVIARKLAQKMAVAKRKAPKRKAAKRKAPKRKAAKRKAPKRKAAKRKAPKRKQCWFLLKHLYQFQWMYLMINQKLLLTYHFFQEH